jgi:transcriptional regulator of acetoin/glycerol metabolism
MLYAFCMPKLDRQLEALAGTLAELDENDAQRELQEVETRIAADTERARLLRTLLTLKRDGSTVVFGRAGVGKTATFRALVQNGKPKTREAIMVYFEAAANEPHDVKDVRAYLRTLGINVTDEAIRQNLRGLNDEGVLDRPDHSHYKLSPSWASQE